MGPSRDHCCAVATDVAVTTDVAVKTDVAVMTDIAKGAG